MTEYEEKVVDALKEHRYLERTMFQTNVMPEKNTYII
jgi:hypothetical protein